VDPEAVNQRVGRVKRVFKWARRKKARDMPPVGPIPDAVVEATLQFLNRHVRGLVEFQRLTGCRPGEACKLRRCNIDTSGPQWRFQPPAHKTAHRGKTRTVTIGPKAQALLAAFPTAAPTDYVFSPARAVAEFRSARAAARKTPRYPSHEARNAAVRKSAPKRVPGPRYRVTSYEMAVARACKKAGVPRWAPNQLRHTFASEVRKAHGLEAAQVLLGHSRADVTQIYAERNQGLADKVDGEIG
jgi:integrase